MPRASLPPNRNRTELSEEQVDRVFWMFRALDRRVPIRHIPDGRTCFVVRPNPQGNGNIGEICFGNDIHPGQAILDPNSILSPQAAAAHEIAHYHRWLDGTELPQGQLDHIDEAMTSLTAVLRFTDRLEPIEVRQLISDALQRLQLHAQGVAVEQVPMPQPPPLEEAQADDAGAAPAAGAPLEGPAE
jgi:hypothetical protein